MATNRTLKGVITQGSSQLYPQYRGMWEPVPYELADLVRYNNALYVAESYATANDVPGVSPLWKVVIEDGGLVRDAQGKLVQLTGAIDVAAELVTNLKNTQNNIIRQNADMLASTTRAIDEVRSLVGTYSLGREPQTGDPAGTYRWVDPTGNVIDIAWNGNVVTGRSAALATKELTDRITSSLKRISVDAALYGVAEGASVQTLMDAIAATPDGGTLVCPSVILQHDGQVNMWLLSRKNLTIQGNGLKVEAIPGLPDETGVRYSDPALLGNKFTGGFKFAYCENVVIYDMEYDGRLDARVPYGGDLQGGGPKSGWNILNGCEGVELINCKGTRCMMDGVCIGGVEPEFLPASYNAPEPADWTMALAPKNTVLRNFTALYNYRQGLSVVGCEGLLIDGGKYSFTGRLPDGEGGVKKWTLPGAGIDLEAWYYWGHYNLGIRMINSPEISDNKGTGLLIENGTRGLRCESLWTHHNMGEGVNEAGIKGVMDNYVNCISEYNQQGATADSWRPYEIGRSGIRPTQRGVIRSGRHVGGLLVDTDTLDPDVQGMMIIATDPRPGETCGHTFIQSGGELRVNPDTGEFNGWDNAKIAANPNADPSLHVITKPMLKGGGVVANNTVINATHKIPDWAAFTVKLDGGRAIGNEARKTTTEAIAATRGMFIEKADYASGNTGSGYAVPMMSNARGERLPRFPTPYFTIVQAAGPAGNTFTAADLSLRVNLIRDDADVLAYEITWEASYNKPPDPHTEVVFDIYAAAAPTPGSSLVFSQMTARNRSDQGGEIAAAWAENDYRVRAVLPDKFSYMIFRAVAEIRRI